MRRLREPVVARRGGDALRVDRLRVLAEGVEQRGRGERVDQARDPAARRVDLLHRRAAERIPRAAAHPHAMLDVFDRLLQRQRPQTVTHSDALPQRRVGEAVDAHLQLRLSDEQHGQEVLIVELKVRQQADLVERRLRRDELGLVDDQHRLAAAFAKLEELGVDLVEKAVAEAARLEAEAARNRSEKLRGREARVDQEHDRARLAEAVDEGAGERGLSRADVADEQRQLLLLHRVLQTRQRLAVLCALVEKRRIRSLPEGLGREAEERFVRGRIVTEGAGRGAQGAGGVLATAPSAPRPLRPVRSYAGFGAKIACASLIVTFGCDWMPIFCTTGPRRFCAKLSKSDCLSHRSRTWKPSSPNQETWNFAPFGTSPSQFTSRRACS